MKKLMTVTAAAAFVLATGAAMAQDSKETRPNLKTPTEQQMDTQATEGANSMNKMNKTDMEKSGTTGAASSTEEQSGSKVPGKPTDTIKDSTK